MRKVKTARDAKGVVALKTRPTTTADITKIQVPPRTARNIRRGHMVRGARNINHIGWKPWEQEAAEMRHIAERQRYDYANRYHNALERSQDLLRVVRKRREELQAIVEDLDASNEELQATTEEMEATNEELQATNEELHATTEEMERTSAYLQTLMDSMLDILMTTDTKGMITDVNPTTERISGYSREELIGQPFSQFFTDPERAQAGVEQVLAEGQVTNYELALVTKIGREVLVSYNASVLPGPGGRAAGVLGSARDITKSKQAAEELARQTEDLARQAEELARSNAELEQFAYIASHDLQEPLRKVQAFGNRLETKYGDVLSDEGLDYLERMQNAANRMRLLIEQLLSFSRVTSREEPFAPVDLAEAARQVVADMAATIEEAGGRVEVGDMPTIEADSSQMYQLLQNLIGNGLKFHKEDEPPVVEVEGKILRSICRITVEDNGIGFDEKYLDRIFTIFQRLHGRSEYEGTGVGLAICRKIAERHGGRITAKSAPGQGAKLIVTLPIKRQKGEEKP